MHTLDISQKADVHVIYNLPFSLGLKADYTEREPNRRMGRSIDQPNKHKGFKKSCFQSYWDCILNQEDSHRKYPNILSLHHAPAKGNSVLSVHPCPELRQSSPSSQHTTL
uniref:Uncharacterized protein n=1 Tax=Sphaerodactylus townsendi TaxID=933632 RepID=A0ACB8EA11_9SAUR